MHRSELAAAAVPTKLKGMLPPSSKESLSHQPGFGKSPLAAKAGQ